MPTEILSFGSSEAGEMIPGNDILVIHSVMDPICQKVLKNFALTQEERQDFMGLSDWSLGLYYDLNNRHLFEKLLNVCKLNIDESIFVATASDLEKYGHLMNEFGWGWVDQKEALVPAFNELHNDKNLARRDYFCTLRLKNFLEAGLARYGQKHV